MNIKKQYKYLISVLVPSVILLCMLITPLSSLVFGQEIILETKPVDPRDVFRGDYVTLNYNICDVDVSKLSKDINKDDRKIRNKTLYATLEKFDEYYDIKEVSLERPKNGLYIKCKLSYWGWMGDTVRLEYGLDKYFVPENTGLELENAARSGKLFAKVKVFNGYPVLTGIDLK